MTIQELIDNGVLNGDIGNLDERCCGDCIDHDGTDSTDLTPGSRKCGELRIHEEVECKVDDILVLIDCDSCECDANMNRAALFGHWESLQN